MDSGPAVRQSIVEGVHDGRKSSLHDDWEGKAGWERPGSPYPFQPLNSLSLGLPTSRLKHLPIMTLLVAKPLKQGHLGNSEEINNKKKIERRLWSKTKEEKRMWKDEKEYKRPHMAHKA